MAITKWQVSNEVQYATSFDVWKCLEMLTIIIVSEVHSFKMQLFLSFNQFHLLCERPRSGDLSEKTLEVHRNQTLGEATERAHKVDSALECLCHPTSSLHYSIV